MGFWILEVEELGSLERAVNLMCENLGSWMKYFDEITLDLRSRVLKLA